MPSRTSVFMTWRNFRIWSVSMNFHWFLSLSSILCFNFIDIYEHLSDLQLQREEKICLCPAQSLVPFRISLFRIVCDISLSLHWLSHTEVSFFLRACLKCSHAAVAAAAEGLHALHVHHALHARYFSLIFTFPTSPYLQVSMRSSRAPLLFGSFMAWPRSCHLCSSGIFWMVYHLLCCPCTRCWNE